MRPRSGKRSVERDSPRVATARGPLIAVALVILLAIAWRASPLRDVASVEWLVRHGRGLAQSPMAPFALLIVYLVASLVLMPLTLLIAATLVIFGAWPGFAYALIASSTSAAFVYGAGRFVGRDAVGDWLERQRVPLVAAGVDRVVRHGLLWVALVRLTPIPFSLVNLAAGAARIRFVDFIAGTVLGLLPVTTLFAGLANRIEAWLADPDPGQAIGLAASVVAVVALLWTLRRWAAARERRA